MLRERLSHAGVFLALAVLSVAVGGCFEIDRSPVDRQVEPVDKSDRGCGLSFPTPIYEIVNNTKQTIFYTVQEKDYHYPKDSSVPPGGIERDWLVNGSFIVHSWRTDSEISFVLTALIAIRLDQNTIAYYTGYPRSLSDELDSWLVANQSNLTSSFYTPKPTVNNMDAYGLFYVVRNTGKIRLGLPTTESNRCDAYTNLDSLNRPHSVFNFVMTFTVNGPINPILSSLTKVRLVESGPLVRRERNARV